MISYSLNLCYLFKGLHPCHLLMGMFEKTSNVKNNLWNFFMFQLPSIPTSLLYSSKVILSFYSLDLASFYMISLYRVAILYVNDKKFFCAMSSSPFNGELLNKLLNKLLKQLLKCFALLPLNKKKVSLGARKIMFCSF